MSNESAAQANPEETPDIEAPAPAAAPDTAALEADLAKARDDMLRALAEAENTRRRAERQVAEARLYAIDRFARDLLPVADTLGRALAAMPPNARDTADDATRTLLAGIEMTERALVDAFARHGLKQIGAKGDVFDPHLHQAVAQAPSDVAAGLVGEVMQPGYVLGDRVLRAAMVLVSAGQAAKPPSGDGAAGGGVDIKV
jgi:molecular chaperone GrpE